MSKQAEQLLKELLARSGTPRILRDDLVVIPRATFDKLVHFLIELEKESDQ